MEGFFGEVFEAGLEFGAGGGEFSEVEGGESGDFLFGAGDGFLDGIEVVGVEGSDGDLAGFFFFDLGFEGGDFGGDGGFDAGDFVLGEGFEGGGAFGGFGWLFSGGGVEGGDEVLNGLGDFRGGLWVGGGGDVRGFDFGEALVGVHGLLGLQLGAELDEEAEGLDVVVVPLEFGSWEPLAVEFDVTGFGFGEFVAEGFGDGVDFGAELADGVFFEEGVDLVLEGFFVVGGGEGVGGGDEGGEVSGFFFVREGFGEFGDVGLFDGLMVDDFAHGDFDVDDVAAFGGGAFVDLAVLEFDGVCGGWEGREGGDEEEMGEADGFHERKGSGKGIGKGIGKGESEGRLGDGVGGILGRDYGKIRCSHGGGAPLKPKNRREMGEKSGRLGRGGRRGGGLGEEVDGLVDDVCDWGETPDAFVAAGEETVVGADELVAPRAERGGVADGGRVEPHVAVHGWGDEDGGAGGEGDGGEGVIGDAVGEFGEDVGGGRGDEEEVGGVGELDVAGVP